MYCDIVKYPINEIETETTKKYLFYGRIFPLAQKNTSYESIPNIVGPQTNILSILSLRETKTNRYEIIFILYHILCIIIIFFSFDSLLSSQNRIPFQVINDIQ